MNEMVKSSVDARKQAIYNSYNIDNKDLENKVNDFFKELESFASKYNDIMDFENAFQSSDLNSRYINLFTEIGSKCTPKTFDTNDTVDDTEYKETSDAEYLLDELGRPARRQARQQVDDTLRSTPIVGDIMEAKQHFDLFNKFKKSKKNQD